MKQDNPSLTSFTAFAGCGAKLGPEFLDKALCELTQPIYPDVLSDFSHAEDCGVYKISDEVAMVNTLDFFPPMCDDPFSFGRIAAANALSDIYSMGATPITALSIVCFPETSMDISVLKDILKGALDALIEAKVALVGGHSIKDTDVKFGLSITGTIHPMKILKNNTHKDKSRISCFSIKHILIIPSKYGNINTYTQVCSLAIYNPHYQNKKTAKSCFFVLVVSLFQLALHTQNIVAIAPYFHKKVSQIS